QQFSIVADTAQKEKAVISGSADNDLFKQYSIFSTEKGKLLQQLEAAFKAATNKADSTRIREQIIKTDKALRDYQENIIKTKPQSLLATLF
ncbi:hypothetical protein ABTE93_20115, partial [Acinetobacter baumannii]